MAAAARKKAPQAKPAAKPAESNGNGATDDVVVARSLLSIPAVGKGQKVDHGTLVSAELLAEYDKADDTRAERAAAVWGDADELTGAVLRKLRPLLREQINPRHVVTTGPADGGKPMVTTGIKSVQVQIDRLDEVLGADHFRILARHIADGTRCRVHVVLGNDLLWCTADPDTFDLRPYTELPDGGVQTAAILAHSDGWGGHKRGSAPADIWKGSFTNAAKLAIARIGPGDHVYRLEFEDDPHQPEQRQRRQQAPAQAAQPAPAASGGAEPTEDQATALIAAHLAEDGPLKALRKQADDGLKMFTRSAVKRWQRLAAADTEEKLRDLIALISNALDQQAFDTGDGS